MIPAEPRFDPILDEKSRTEWTRVAISIALIVVTLIAVIVSDTVFPQADPGFGFGGFLALNLMVFYVSRFPERITETWKVIALVILEPFIIVFSYYAISAW